MQIIQNQFGPFEKDGLGFLIAPQDGDTQNLLDWAQANGYARRPSAQVTLAIARHKKKQQLSAARYAEEVGGFTQPGGMFIRTDARTQAALSNGHSMARYNPAFVFQNWKLADGTFIDMDAQTVIGIYDAITAHVAACFAKEARLTSQIDSATTLAEINAIVW